MEQKDGTFAVPRFYLPKNRPEYVKVKNLFETIQWPQNSPRTDFLEHRFNAFCTILEAIISDEAHVMHTILNKSHYDVSKWPIPYRAMRDVMNALINLGWIVRTGKREKYRNYRYKALGSSPLLKLKLNKIKLSSLYWEPPVVSIRRGDTDLEKAPLDFELMANPTWKAWIAKYLTPPMEMLNDKLLNHHFVLFPYGKANDEVQLQYQRIYTNTSGFKEEPSLLHGRIYPKNFQFPSKKLGWRQMTLIDDQPTVEVDVHASSLTILSNDYHSGFNLPDTTDLYQYGDLKSLDRELVKIVTQAIINGVSHDTTSWPPSIKEQHKTRINDQKWKTYAQAVVQTYPNLQNLRQNLGMFLMLQEANIILEAMNFLLDKGIGCLSLHDCLIVPVENQNDAIDAFNAAYQRFDMNLPVLHIG